MYTIAKTLKKPKWIRIDEWVKKMGDTHRAILVIKGCYHTMCSNKGVERITLSDVRQRKTSIL